MTSNYVTNCIAFLYDLLCWNVNVLLKSVCNCIVEIAKCLNIDITHYEQSVALSRTGTFSLPLNIKLSELETAKE